MRTLGTMTCVIGVVLSFAAGAYAVDVGPGGYIYWNVQASQTLMKVYRAQIDTSWNLVAGSIVNFDCLTQTPAGGATDWESSPYMHHNVEVLDPRAQGGTGSLVLALHTDDCTTRNQFYNDMMQIYQISNPTGSPTNTMICDARLAGSAAWNTRDLATALPAPANWVPGTTSNGYSLVTMKNTAVTYGDGSYYLHNTTTPIINSTLAADGKSLVATPADEGGITPQWTLGTAFDQEFGLDKALYRLQSDQKITRTWPKNAAMDNTAGSTYFAGSAAVGRATGLAAGPGNLGKTMLDGKAASASPIVYMTAYDGNSKLALFALQDVNGDNVVDATNDRTVMLWENFAGNPIYVADSGNSYGAYDSQDVEVVMEASGKRMLLFNSYYQELHAIELADNGLWSSGAAGKLIIGYPNFGISSYQNRMGFELDTAALPAIPEPATLLLLGTGALGAFGYIRRQRMR